MSSVRFINQALRDEGIIATGFVIGKQLNRHTVSALNAFAKGGHQIGNYSWPHANYRM
ncbi:MAG TPA: hypothetical protein DEA94_03755 [Rhodobacteraceae bacterium]|nr:hypothetical protein [Paracoccaceae bacterium]